MAISRDQLEEVKQKFQDKINLLQDKLNFIYDQHLLIISGVKHKMDKYGNIGVAITGKERIN